MKIGQAVLFMENDIPECRSRVEGTVTAFDPDANDGAGEVTIERDGESFTRRATSVMPRPSSGLAPL